LITYFGIAGIGRGKYVRQTKEKQNSASDPECIGADPDPPFDFDADPVPTFFTPKQRKLFYKIFKHFFPYGQIFLGNTRSNNQILKVVSGEKGGV